MKPISPAEILASRPLREVNSLILKLMMIQRMDFQEAAFKFGYQKTARVLRSSFLDDDGDTFTVHRSLEVVGIKLFRDSEGWLSNSNGEYLKARLDALDMTNRDKVLRMYPEHREDPYEIERKKDALEKFLPEGKKIDNIARICVLTGDAFPTPVDVRKPAVSKEAAARVRQLYFDLDLSYTGGR